MSRPVVECWRCEQPITDWSTAVEDSDGDAVCGECHAAKLDEYTDAFDGMFKSPLETLDDLTAREGRNGGK